MTVAAGVVKSMKAQLTLSLDPKDIQEVEARASMDEISRSAWLRRAIRRQLQAEQRMAALLLGLTPDDNA